MEEAATTHSLSHSLEVEEAVITHSRSHSLEGEEAATTDSLSHSLEVEEADNKKPIYAGHSNGLTDGFARVRTNSADCETDIDIKGSIIKEYYEDYKRYSANGLYTDECLVDDYIGKDSVLAQYSH